MLLTASCEFEFAICIKLRACSGWGFMCMKVAIYLLYMQLLPLLSLLRAQTLRWVKTADRCSYSYSFTPITAVRGHAATLRFGQSCRTYSDLTEEVVLK